MSWEDIIKISNYERAIAEEYASADMNPPSTKKLTSEEEAKFVYEYAIEQLKDYVENLPDSYPDKEKNLQLIEKLSELDGTDHRNHSVMLSRFSSIYTKGEEWRRKQ